MKYFFTMLVLLSFAVAHSQSDFRVKHIAVSDGLSNGRIFDIQKDSLGYMWFATANGLTRYSGTSFKKYKFGNEKSAFDPSVIKLCNFEGKIYALLQRGALFNYDYTQDSWRLVFETPGEIFTSMEVLDKEHLIIGTTNGFFTLDLNDNSISEKQYSGLTYIRRIKRLNEYVYVSTSKGLHKLSMDSAGSFSRVDSILIGKDILDFEIDVNEVFWIGTENEGVFRYYQENLKAVSFMEEEQISARDIVLRDNGTVLVAVDRYGLFILDALGSLKHQVSYDPDNPNSLSQNSIYTIFVDERAIWLGVGEIGLNVLNELTNEFENISHERYGKNTIPNDIIRSIYQDDQGAIWFGTEGGLTKQDTEGLWHLYRDKSELLSTPILSIVPYQGQLLLGTYGQGLLTYRASDGKVQPYTDVISLKRVFATSVDGDYLWVEGLDGPVYQLIGDSIVNKYSTGQVKIFEKKDETTMLVGTVEGIYQINTVSKAVTKLAFQENPITNIYALCYDHATKLLWIGNDHGLTQYSYETGQISPATKLNEVSGPVYSILRRKKGELWIGAEQGLFKYTVDAKHYRRYSINDGQMIDEYGIGASAVLLDDRIAFGGPKGAVIFDPDKIIIDDHQPLIYLNKFTVNGTEPESQNFKNINYADQIALAYSENTLQFDIDYLKFHGSLNHSIEWQLEGFDKQKKIENNKKSIVYRNLEPGQYHLTVSSVNADGFPSLNSIDLKINISKPFWLQWWAFSLYLLLFGLLAYLAIVMNRARQNKIFSDEKIKFFIDVAHDIRTPVSLIRLASDQLLQNHNVEESVQIINRYTKNLNDYVTELLDFQKSERKKLRVLAYEFDVVNLLKTIVDDFKPMADQKQLSISYDFPDPIMIWGDKIQLGRVFTNLMSNAIKYNHDYGSIAISMTTALKSIEVVVEDTGLGIPKNQIHLIFQRFHRADNALKNEVRGTGVGLMLSKRIVDLHKGKIICESEENIGSTFRVQLLKGKDHFAASDIKIQDPKPVINRLTEVNVKGKKVVLVIEDNEDILSFIKNSFSSQYLVITANDGKDGLLKVFESRPDLVISDVMLPGMNGKEICHIIKNDRKLSSIPVILLTALIGMDDKVAGLEVGADYYLEKPFDIQVLNLAVKNLLNRSQLDREIGTKNYHQSAQSPEESLLSNVIEIINKNLSNHEFSIDQLCEEVGLSRSNLFRKMKAIAGFSPSDLILEIKLNKAKQLLSNEPNIRIEDAAYQSGFNDPRYFSTLFKKHFKKTPSEFQSSQNQ